MTIADIIRHYKPEMQVKRVKPGVYEIRIIAKDDDEEFGMTLHHMSSHKPTLEEVLRRMAKVALQHEATKLPRLPDDRKRGARKDDRSFIHWCTLYGFDPKSTESRERYLLIRKRSEQLRYVLGDEAYEKLLQAVK